MQEIRDKNILNHNIDYDPGGVTYLFLNALYINTIQGAFFIYIHVYIQKKAK